MYIQQLHPVRQQTDLPGHQVSRQIDFERARPGPYLPASYLDTRRGTPHRPRTAHRGSCSILSRVIPAQNRGDRPANSRFFGICVWCRPVCLYPLGNPAYTQIPDHRGQVKRGRPRRPRIRAAGESPGHSRSSAPLQQRAQLDCPKPVTEHPFSLASSPVCPGGSVTFRPILSARTNVSTSHLGIPINPISSK